MKFTHVKWSLPVLVILVVLSIPVVAEGGGKWSRMDPILEMNGHTINVWAVWPSEHNCDIQAPIRFKMFAPGAEFIEDSQDSFDCDGEKIEISTKTKIVERGEEGTLTIGAHFKASAKFPVGVLVYVDGELTQRCKGKSNKPFRCDTIKIH